MKITAEQLEDAAQSLLANGDKTVSEEMNELKQAFDKQEPLKMMLLMILITGANDPQGSLMKAFCMGFKLGHNIGETSKLEEIARL